MTQGSSSRTVDLGGPVHYLDCGGEGSPPMVLIHGLGLSHALWAGVTGPLAGRRRVYAIDLVGHGSTPSAGRPADLPHHLQIIHRFLGEVAGEPAVLVGHSTGGHLAIKEAAAAPDRVAGLVLIDAATPVPWSSPKLVAGELAVLPLRLPGTGELIARTIVKKQPQATVAALLGSCTPHPERIPPHLVAAQVEAATSWQPLDDARRAFLQTVRSLYAHNGQSERFFEQAAAVRAPVLAIHGELDPLVPLRAATQLQGRLPHWKLRVLPGIGHTPMLEDPDALVALMEEWASG